MARGRHAYLLDPRFQLKWTGYLVVVVVLVMAGLGVVIGKTARRGAETATIAVKQAEKAYEESRSNNILARRTVQLAGDENATLKTIMDESLSEVDAESEKNLAAVRQRQVDIARYQKHIERLLLGAGLALLFILLLMGVLITHRIVGPVHKMKRLLRRVSTGRLVIEERLRKHDELADLFDTFLQMTYSLRAMQNARLATLDDTLRAAESTATPAEVVDGLRALRAQMVVGLEARRPSVRPPPSV
jgi:nitrogen fixation/metabolism regulation signal transduction histidine kinase